MDKQAPHAHSRELHKHREERNGRLSRHKLDFLLKIHNFNIESKHVGWMDSWLEEF